MFKLNAKLSPFLKGTRNVVINLWHKPHKRHPFNPDIARKVDFLTIYKTLANFLQKEGCRFAVIGAHALHAYGLSRATGDLDFIADAQCQPRIVAFLESLGYETLLASPGYSNHLHPLSGMGRIDFVYVTGEAASVIFAEASRSLSLDNASINVAVPKPEHLIAMKLFAMKNDPSRRYQDMADIQYLLSLPDINQEETRRYFERYGFGNLYEELQGKISS